MYNNVFIVLAVFLAVLVFGLTLLFVSMYKKVPQSQALIRSGFGGVKVSFNGVFVIPIIHKMELMDITGKTIEIHKTGKDGLISKDGKRVDVKADFIIRVNPVWDDIQKIASTIGVSKANDSNEIKNMFTNLFIEGLKYSSSQFEAETIHQHLPKFKMQTLEYLGNDLNGFILWDLHIYHLEKN
jgi:uncharacterized membrane protein YqiK